MVILEVKDKGKVESVKNRLLLMNGSEQHKCTNQIDDRFKGKYKHNYK